MLLLASLLLSYRSFTTSLLHMKPTFFSVLAVGLAGAALSSCTRANYALLPRTPAYLATEGAPALLMQRSAVVTAAAGPAQPTTSAWVQPAAQDPPAVAAASFVPKHSRHPTPLLANTQRMVLKKLTKQLARPQASHQHVTKAAHTAAKKDVLICILVALVGVALVVGGALLCGGVAGTIAGILLILLGAGVLLLSAYVLLLAVSNIDYR
jgi:hypothetical protein